MPNTVYKTKKKQKLKPLPSVKKLYKNAKIDSGDARQRQKDLVSAQRLGMGIGPGTYTRAVLNGKIVYNGTMLNDEGLPIPDPRYGLIMSGEYVQGLRGPYKDLGHDIRVGVPMIMEVIPGTGIFPKSRTVVNYLGDPGYLDALNRLAEAYNINGGNIMIGDKEKPYLLPEVLILYRKNGGTMKRLIPKHLSGSTLDKVVDAGGYLVPFYGTYKSYKDWEKNKTWGNALMTGVSGLGDALLLLGVGEGLKAIPAAKAAARMTKAADTIEAGAKATREAAGLARNSGNIGLAEKLESKAFDQSVRASDKAFEASLLNSRAKNYKDLATFSAEGSTYTKAGFGPRGSQGNRNSKKLNLVEKRSSSLASTYYPKFK